jgi:hypothetical protein
MKKAIVFVLVIAALAVAPLAAQDFTAPKSQFLSFGVGAGIGYDFDASDIVATPSFTVDFAVIDKLSIGIVINTEALTGLSVSYSFLDTLGATIGIGLYGSGGSDAGISLGAYYDLFGGRSDRGLATSLRLGFGYSAPVDDFGRGMLLFTTTVSFGI